MRAQAAFISSYMHSVIIFAVIAALIFTVFTPSNPKAAELGSIHQVYHNLLIRAQVRLAINPYRTLSAVQWDEGHFIEGTWSAEPLRGQNMRLAAEPQPQPSSVLRPEPVLSASHFHLHTFMKPKSR